MIISTHDHNESAITDASTGFINYSLAGRWIKLKGYYFQNKTKDHHQAICLTGFSSSDFFLNYGGDNGRVLLINA